MSEDRKTIFITGAASGMGRATAILFAAKGWFVGAVDVNDQGLADLAEEIGADNCFTARLDVTDKPAFDDVMARFGAISNGKLDIMYNNAGIGATGYLEDIPYEKSLEVIQVNFVGVVNGIYAALPLLKAADNSLCFTTSSSSATFGMPGLAIYSATKHAVKGLTEALSIEFMRHNVRAADVLPGLIDTEILNTTNIYVEEKPIPREGFDPDNAPKTGIMRLIPAEAVAETVWKAYQSDKIHWYVPDELVSIDQAKGESPEKVREGLIKGTLW